MRMFLLQLTNIRGIFSEHLFTYRHIQILLLQLSLDMFQFVLFSLTLSNTVQLRRTQNLHIVVFSYKNLSYRLETGR